MWAQPCARVTRARRACDGQRGVSAPRGAPLALLGGRGAVVLLRAAAAAAAAAGRAAARRRALAAQAPPRGAARAAPGPGTCPTAHPRASARASPSPVGARPAAAASGWRARRRRAAAAAARGSLARRRARAAAAAAARGRPAARRPLARVLARHTPLGRSGAPAGVSRPPAPLSVGAPRGGPRRGPLAPRRRRLPPRRRRLPARRRGRCPVRAAGAVVPRCGAARRARARARTPRRGAACTTPALGRRGAPARVCVRTRAAVAFAALVCVPGPPPGRRGGRVLAPVARERPPTAGWPATRGTAVGNVRDVGTRRDRQAGGSGTRLAGDFLSCRRSLRLSGDSRRRRSLGGDGLRRPMTARVCSGGNDGCTAHAAAASGMHCLLAESPTSSQTRALRPGSAPGAPGALGARGGLVGRWQSGRAEQAQSTKATC